MRDAILVLGASGFIGRRLCVSLAKDGIPVLAATRRPMDFRDAGIRSTSGTFDTPVQFDSLLEQCAAVVHTASSSTPGSSAGDPLSELSANLQPTLALLHALQRHPGIPLLYLSSGGTLYGNRGNKPHAEGTPLSPRSYHGAAKSSAEQFMGAWVSQFTASATILRPSNVYGPGQRPREGFGVIPAAFACAKEGKAFTVLGDGSAVRDYLYIDDLVDACRLAINQPAEGLAIHNVASGECVSLLQLLDLIDRVTARTIRRISTDGRAVDVIHSTLDCGSIHAALGWRASTELEQGLEQAWHWFKDSP